MTEKLLVGIQALKTCVLEMGMLANEMLAKSVAALEERDVEKADWVISQKDRLADLDERIESEGLKLIALHQPMAENMRIIATALKLNTYLARAGRYGKDIANVTKDLADIPHLGKLVSIPYQAQIVIGMISDALKAFGTGDIALLEDMAHRDNQVDALRYSIFRECVSYMMEDPRNITRCSHYMMISRYLERCGDHACKMAEKVHYMVTGERVEIK